MDISKCIYFTESLENFVCIKAIHIFKYNYICICIFKQIQYFVEVFIEIRIIAFFKNFDFIAIQVQLAKDIFVFLHTYQSIYNE